MSALWYSGWKRQEVAAQCAEKCPDEFHHVVFQSFPLTVSRSILHRPFLNFAHLICPPRHIVAVLLLFCRFIHDDDGDYGH
jgi:hypothetical protein